MNALFTVFASILSSGVVAAAIGASFNEAKERWLLRRSKIEEIYLSSATWLKHVNAHYLLYLRVCAGKLTYHQALELITKNSDLTIGDQNLRMKMNIKMYEPTLNSLLDAIEHERENVNSIIAKIEQSCSANGDASEFRGALNKQLAAFGAAGDALLAAVVVKGAEIGAEKGQVARGYETVRRQVQRYWLNLSTGWN